MDNSDFLCMHRMRLVFSQVKGPILFTARQHYPQHFHCVRTGSALLRTSHPHVSAQTAGEGVLWAGWQEAAGSARVGTCMPGASTPDARTWPGPDEIDPGGSHRTLVPRPVDGPPAQSTVGPLHYPLVAPPALRLPQAETRHAGTIARPPLAGKEGRPPQPGSRRCLR